MGRRCAEKVRYRTEARARDALLQIRIKVALRDRPVRERSAYLCREGCRGWHLTKGEA